MITRVAIKRDGVVYSLPMPNRHHDVIKLMSEEGVPHPVTKGAVQGFIHEHIFMDREEAAWLALNLGQVTKLIVPPRLYSEDLW